MKAQPYTKDELEDLQTQRAKMRGQCALMPLSIIDHCLATISALELEVELWQKEADAAASEIRRLVICTRQGSVDFFKEVKDE